MSKYCTWCNSDEIRLEEQSVYWELPDGTKAIEIVEAPTIACLNCGMNYQEESIVKEIEETK